MFCPKCGKMNPDDREFCSGCNAVLHEPEEEKPKKKKSIAGKIIALVAAAAIAVTAVAAVSCERGETPVIAEACYISVIY